MLHVKETNKEGVETVRGITEQKEVEWEVRKYYWKLYRKEETVIHKEDILKMTGHVKRVSEANKEGLEKTITMEEVSKTLKNTRNNVALRVGGFTGAFYKVFLMFFKENLVRSYARNIYQQRITIKS